MGFSMAAKAQTNWQNWLPPDIKVAIVHDWLDGYRGGEKVLEAILEMFPNAPIYTLFYDPRAVPETIHSREVIFPKWIAPLRRWRQHLLPLLPFLVESFPTEEYDLIISSSSCVAKGVMTHPKTKHISYIHSPMRYIWDQRQHYLHGKGALIRGFIHFCSTPLRIWDQVTTNRIDLILVNSQFIAQRVQRFYRREAQVLPPAVDVAVFDRPELSKSTDREGRYLLVAGAFVSYKRFDLAIRACESAQRKLVVAGSGPEEARLRQLAGKCTTFEISPDQRRWVELFQGADAFIFPAEEDFGITAIESMAAGTPVIAFRGGGALDYIEEGHTGTFFAEQNPECLRIAIENFDPSHYDQKRLITYAEMYKKELFQNKLSQFVKELLGGS